MTLSWDPGPSSDVAGYVILYGTTPGIYKYNVVVGNHTFATVPGLAGGVTYYFVVEGYSSHGVLGDPSNEVSASTTNAPPVLNDPGSLSFNEGGIVHVQLAASDPDGDPLTYSATGLPLGLTINPSSGVISGSLSYLTAGVYNVTVTVADGVLPGTLSTSRNVTWTVLNVNGPPAVAAIPNQINSENDLVSLTATATDPDGDSITWSAAGLPAGLSINPASGTISGQLTYASAGTYPVTVIATAAGQTGRQTFQWTIANVDRPPGVAAIPNQTSGQYARVVLTVTASDPDGDVVSFSAAGLPPGLTINAITGQISGTLSPASVGVYAVTVTASAGGLTGSASFSWTVTNQIAFPLKASANGRYLVDQNNVPFFMVGDSPQSIIGNLSIADATTFLNDRKNRGFNTVWINLVCRTAQYGCSASGITVDGIKPFNTNNDLSTPNEAYFAKADAILNVAASLNMLVILDPIDTGGWLTTLESNTLAKVRAYGQYVGNRYKNLDNIIWMSGNDFQTWSNEADDVKVREVALGIKDVDTRHIHTLELDYLHFASGSLDDPSWAPILGLEGAYTYYPTYAQVLKGYNRQNFLPVFLVEAAYEGENLNGSVDVPETQRRQEYWTALSGSTGQLFGNRYTWTFASGWPSHLNTPGATQFGYVKSLFEPRAWFNLVPDQTHTVLTSGYGTFADGSPDFNLPSGITSILGNDYATAAATQDGTLIMAYLPTVRTVTIDMSRLSGAAVARWFDPTLGTFVSIAGSPFQNVGTQAFTPPAGAHGDGAHDWVLVIEANPGILLQNPGDRSNPRGAHISLQVMASDPYGLLLIYSATNLPPELSINSSTGLISGTLSDPAVYNVTITASDGTLTASRSFVWTVTINNNPPVLTSPGDQTTASGSAVALQLTATDVDGIGVSYSATGLPPGLSINSQTGLISGTLSGGTAIYGITATVSDGLLSSSQSFLWTVQLGSSFVQMNYADPQTPNASVSVTFPGAQTAGNLNVVVVGWNDTIRTVQSVSDTSGNTYSLAVGPTVGTGLSQAIYYAKNINAASSNTITVVFSAAASFPDVRIAEYKGLDRVNPVDAAVAAQGNSASSDSGLLTTTNANDLLVAANTQAQGTVSAGAGYISRVITSPDRDILEDRLVGSVGSYNATAPMTGPGGWIMQLVAFRAAGGGLNQAPTLNAVANQTHAEATAVSLQLVGGDPDGNPITYSVVGLPAGLSVNQTTGLIYGTLTYSSAGVYQVTATVSDQSLTASRVFTWTVTNVNRAPVIVTPADRTSLENTSATLNLIASDPDGNSLTFSAVGLPPGLAINATTGVISGTLSFTSAGTHVVTVTVDDGQGAANSSTSTLFDWFVTNLNRPPVLSPVPNQTSAESDTITLNVIATDPDADDTLSYSASGLPGGLTINAVTGAITGSISYTSAGPHLVTVNVFDGTVSVSQAFAWTVTDTNRPPILASIANQTNGETDVVNLAVSGSDPDGDTVTYSATGLPAGLSINPSSGAITGTLTYTSAGVFSVTVTVSDLTLSASQTFTWTVANVNRAPTLAAIANQTNAENDTVNLIAVGSDPDGDTMTYTATGLPPGVSINSASGAIAGTLTYASAGSYGVAVTVSDGTLNASQTFTWTVTNTDRAPVIAPIGNVATATGASVLVSITASDADGDVVTYGATGLPPGTVIDANTGTITGAPSAAGTYVVNVTATGSMLSAAASFAWSVTTVAPTPHASFQQARASTRSGSALSATVAFASSQLAGDSNIVAVAWQSASNAEISSVQDAGGNTYQLIAGPTTTGIGTQAVYYASNIGAAAAGAAVVTVTFTAPVTLSDLRAAEYSGLLALDGAAAASGSGAAIDAAAVLHNSGDLVIAGVFAPTSTASKSTGYDARLAEPGSLLEDGLVAQVSGAVPPVATLSPAGAWIAQVATFTTRNVAPTLNPISNRTDAEGSVVSLQLNASDPDADALTYAPSGPLPDGLTLNASTGLLSGTLSYVSSGPHPVTMCAFDGHEQVCQSFMWTVTNVNLPPVLSNPGNQLHRFGTVVSLPLSGSDPDGTPVTFSANNLPAGLTVNPSTGVISGVPVFASVGVHAVSVTVSDGSLTATQTFTWTVKNRVAVHGDFTGDGKSDIVVFRRSTTTWHTLQSQTNFTVGTSIAWGASNDVVVPGDYDGDGKADVATYRPSTGEWTIKLSSTGATQIIVLGSSGDVPAPGDYDGDGKTDIAIFHAVNAHWTILQSSTSTFVNVTFGLRGDVAVPGDYDGDGQTDLATYRPSLDLWTIRQSSNGATVTISLGETGATLVPADYDGDGKVDAAIYQPATGVWTIRKSSTGATQTTTLGGSGAVPAPGDYDGDGKADVAVFGGSGWSILRSSTSTTLSMNWGIASDIPVMMLPSVYADPPLGNDLSRATDFDGDGKADIVVYRKSNSTWYILLSRSGYTKSMAVTWGSPGDVLVPGDYDGDGLADVATYTPSTGVWSIRLSSTGATQTVTLGGSGDVPVPGDYDGDGKTDIAVFQVSSAQWSIRQSTTGNTIAAALGARGDYAVPADYDGDGKTDLATYRPTSGLWTILRSSVSTTTTLTLGGSGARPVPADYDGDGKADPAVYGGASAFTYVVLQSATGTTVAKVLTGTSPVPGDYDGDGRVDFTVFGPSGWWTINKSTGGSDLSINWGVSTDVAAAQMPSIVASPPFGTDVTRSTDFDGDGISDIFVYRPSTGTWHILGSRSFSITPHTSTAVAWGTSADLPVAGDYDGDGKADAAYFRPSTGTWSILQSTTGTARNVSLGTSGDLPVPGDYDGDGKTDAAVFHPSTGLWSIVLSTTGATQTITLGVRGDIPVPRDYDGDGKTDVAIYHGATGLWTMKLSATGTTSTVTLGALGDIPVPGDYDGDGKADPAVYRSTTSLWSVRQSTTGTVTSATWGSASDLPVPADYDGDGVMDLAVFQPFGGWLVRMSATGATWSSITWGISSDALAGNLTLLNAQVVLRSMSDLFRQTDFDGDGKSDIVVFRPSAGTWHVLQSHSNFVTSNGITWGTSSDKPVPGDYDGDGKTDPAFYRPSTGEWKILLSSTDFTSSLTVVLGATTDRLVPGDYDGDGKTDIAYYRPSTGEWHILTAGSNFTSSITATWGTGSDIPVPGDYDGDGKTDLGIYHANGQWQILLSSTNYTTSMTKNWGISTDIPIPADYDGDGKTDMAVYRPSTGSWYFLYSKNNFTASSSIAWSASSSVQVVGDYDGDGRADLGLFTGGVWNILVSSANYTTTLTKTWGISSDRPLPTRP